MTFDNLIALHEMLWPETNKAQQIAKYDEEDREWDETEPGSEEELYEAADMIIVAAGIARFDYTKGLWRMCRAMMAMQGIDVDVLWDAVEKKMRKNMKRDWEKKDDVGYHHK